MWNRAKFVALLCGVTLVATLPGFATPKKHSSAKQSAPAAVAAPAPAPEPPAPPPTPEQMPPTTPSVTMSNGLLTIVANNSTLGSVLSAVRKLTGATLDAPPMANSERVAVHLGPAPPRDVLNDLLNGSKFDYIILGTPQNADAVAQIILTPRNAGSAQVAGQQNYPPVQQQPNQPINETADNSDDDNGPPEPASPEPTSGMEEQGSSQSSPPPAQANEQNQNSQQGPKTPEQLLKELQQLQQQQQQQQREMNRNPGPQ